jgi:tetratricopeptide (TPR) repeat protein
MRWLKKALGLSGRKAAEDLCMRGYVAAREGRLDAAQKLYDDAVDADPTLGVASFNAGQTALERYNRDAHSLDADAKRARLGEAFTHLTRAVDVDADHAPAWRALARVQERLARPADAEAAWARVEKLLATQSDGDAADRANARTEARRERERLKPAAAVAVAVADVRAHIAAVDLDVEAAVVAIDAAVVAIDAAAAANVVVNAGVMSLLGTLARRAKHPQARAFFEAAIAADAHDIDAHKNLATICLEIGELPAALRASQAAYRLDPIDAGLVCNVGVCHLAMVEAGQGDLGQAREYIALAGQLSPKDPIVQRAMSALDRVERARAAGA